MTAGCVKRKAGRIAGLLQGRYGTPDLGNLADPVDELVYISLSRQTHAANTTASWQSLKSEFSSWEEMLEAPVRKVIKILKPGGFAVQKARWIRASLRLIRERFGRITLEPLREWPDHEVETFLTTLPGVSVKSAKCIAMYSLGRKVLPVDTHVRRISERIGLVPSGLSEKAIHCELEELVPPDLCFSFHVNCVAHGREVCRSTHPACDECALRLSCAYAASKISKRSISRRLGA